MSQTVSAETPRPEIRKDWRYVLGLACFALAMVMPLFSIVVLPLDFPAGIKATIVGVLSLGGPEVALVVAAVLLGKDTLNTFKGRVFAFIRKLLPSRPAPKLRYYTCVTILVVDFLGWYVYGYQGHLLPEVLKSTPYLIAADLVFIGAFIAAGPELWEKIQSVFRWQGRLQAAA